MGLQADAHDYDGAKAPSLWFKRHLWSDRRVQYSTGIPNVYVLPQCKCRPKNSQSRSRRTQYGICYAEASGHPERRIISWPQPAETDDRQCSSTGDKIQAWDKASPSDSSLNTRPNTRPNAQLTLGVTWSIALSPAAAVMPRHKCSLNTRPKLELPSTKEIIVMNCSQT